MDGSGNAVAVWSRGSAERVVVESSDLVGSGPVLSSVRVPRRGTVRTRLTFPVTPVPWAPPLAGCTALAIGDGRSASGARVTHVYRRPGRYRIAATSIDALGQATTVTATVRVARRA